MNDILNYALHLTFSSERPMPAHFTSNGDRGQSFCIDFEPLSADDDYEMASVAWYSVPNLNVSKSQSAAVLRCGEDITVGSFIVTKLGGEALVEDLKKEVITDTIESFASVVENIKEVFSMEEAKKYFDHCAEFGKGRAEGRFVSE